MKRGFGHVEMVLSFVIFVGAIVLALYFFRPNYGDRIVQTSFDYVFREIELNSSFEVVTFNVKINEGIVESVIGFNISVSENALVVDEFGNNLKTRSSDGIVFAESADWNSIEFVDIYVSEEFQSDETLVGIYNEDYYEVGSSRTEKIISWDKLSKLVDSYESDYIALKKEFNIPGRVNFDFSMNSEGESVESFGEIPQNLEVFVEERNFKVVRENKIGEGVLKVRVW